MPGLIRPDSPANIIECLRNAVENAHPRRGLWSPGRFGYADAQKFWDAIKHDPRAVPEIERKIRLYMKSETGQKKGYSAAGFFDAFNELRTAGGVVYREIK
jgi:hypothetical protein